jgi:hypothetical protein
LKLSTLGGFFGIKEKYLIGLMRIDV